MTDNEKLKFDYHKHNLIYISDYIKFADTKAGVALSLNLLLLGFFGKEAKGNRYNNLSLSDVGLYISLILLFISAFLFIWKILWPRYTTNTDFYMSWGGIGSFSNSNDYIAKIESKDSETFIKDMAIQNYDISKVAVKKYFFLKCGFSCLSFGAVLGLISWFFS